MRNQTQHRSAPDESVWTEPARRAFPDPNSLRGESGCPLQRAFAAMDIKPITEGVCPTELLGRVACPMKANPERVNAHVA